MTVLEARYQPGVNVPAYCPTLVRAGRFVKVTGTKTADGAYQIGECGLGERAFGVAAADSAPTTQSAHSVERLVNVGRSGAIVRVVPGANLTAWQEIMSDAQARAIPSAAAVAAALNTGVVGSNNAITFTARAPGAGGNAIRVAFVDPGGTTATLSVDVAENGHDITVNLGRASSAINSTAQNVMDAIEANGLANQLVSVANQSTSTGAGLVAAFAFAALAAGSDPEGAGVALGRVMHDALSSDTFCEVALY